MLTSLGLLKIEIVNVIVSTNLDQPIDIEKIASKLPHAEYEPEVFPGLIYRRSDPKATVIMFSTGKMTSIGAKSEKEGRLAIDTTVRELNKYFTRPPKYRQITTENLIAVGRLTDTIDLTKVVMSISPVRYEPTVYPAAIHKFAPHASILIYRTGNLIYSGARSESEARKGITGFSDLLRTKGCLISKGK